MRVTLSERERAALSLIAHRRNDPKMKANVPNYRISPNKTDEQVHIEGIIAEYAVAKAIGLQVDTTFSLGGDNGQADLVLSDGRSIQVKYRGARGWDYALTTGNAKDFQCDIGILVWPCDDSQDLDIVGWITREGFEEECFSRDYGYGQRVYCRSKELWKIEDLIESEFHKRNSVDGIGLDAILNENRLRAQQSLTEWVTSDSSLLKAIFPSTVSDQESIAA